MKWLSQPSLARSGAVDAMMMKEDKDGRRRAERRAMQAQDVEWLEGRVRARKTESEDQGFSQVRRQLWGLRAENGQPEGVGEDNRCVEFGSEGCKRCVVCVCVSREAGDEW